MRKKFTVENILDLADFFEALSGVYKVFGMDGAYSRCKRIQALLYLKIVGMMLIDQKYTFLEVF